MIGGSNDFMVENAFLLVGDGGFQISERALTIYAKQVMIEFLILEIVRIKLLNDHFSDIRDKFDIMRLIIVLEVAH